VGAGLYPIKLEAIHPLTALIGGLCTRLDARDDMLFQKYFEQIATVEADAIDFKVELRRTIHLALWHAMAACETAEQVEGIVQPLGSLMVALNQQTPASVLAYSGPAVVGWQQARQAASV
jgi:hypothetical protein